MLSSLAKTFTDLFFPLHCFGCGQEGAIACRACLAAIPETEYQECPVCRRPYQKNGAVCRNCRKATAIDGLFVARPYRHRLLRRLEAMLVVMDKDLTLLVSGTGDLIEPGTNVYDLGCATGTTLVLTCVRSGVIDDSCSAA